MADQFERFASPSSIMPMSPALPPVPGSISDGLAGIGQVAAPSPSNVTPSAAPSLVAEKQARIEREAAAKKFLMGGDPTQIQRVAVAANEGNDLAQSELAQDLASGDYAKITAKYGSEVADLANQVHQARTEATHTQNVGRTADERLSDSLLGIGAGAVQGVGGAGAFIGGLVHPLAGKVIGDATEVATDFLRDSQTDKLNDKRALAAVRASLDSEDIDTKYQKDLADGKTFAGLRRFGREFISASQDLIENPELAGDLTAEGIGSLVASGGIAKIGASIAAKGVLAAQGIVGKAADEFLASKAGQEFLSQLTVKGVPASIGLQEAGGAYTQIQSEIQNMSAVELYDNSPEYKRMRIEDGMSHEEARDALANQAALLGGAAQGAVGALTGKLVAKFEANPMNLPGSKSFTEALRNMGEDTIREVTEEGIQGASGSVISNAAIKAEADPNRDVFQGVGTDVAQSMAAAAGMVGVVKAPNVAATGALTAAEIAAKNAASELKTIGNGIVNTIMARNAKVEAGLDAASPVGDNAFAKAARSARETLNKIQTAITEPAAEQPIEAQVSETSAEPTPAPIGQKMAAVLDISPEELNSSPEGVKRLLGIDADPVKPGEPIDRLAVLEGTLKQIQDSQAAEADKLEGALWLYDQAERIKALRNEDTSDLAEALQEQWGNAQLNLDTILSNPKLNAVLQQAQSAESSLLGSMPEVTDASIDTPEVQSAIQKQVLLAQANPAGIDPKFVEAVLNQVAKGKVSTLREKQLDQLRAAAAIAKEINAAADARVALAAEYAPSQEAPADRDAGIKMTRNEILEAGRDSKKSQHSLAQHLRDITGAVQQGDTTRAQLAMDRLRNFAEHMQNKVKAAEASAALRQSDNNKVAFRTWTGTGWLEADHKGASKIGVNPRSQASVRFAREVAIDAKAVSTLYNNLVSIYGSSLKGKALPDLGNPSFGSTAAPASVVPTATVTEAPKPVEKEAPVVAKAEASDRPSEAPAPAKSEGKAAEPSSRETSDPEVREDERQGEPDTGDAGDEPGTTEDVTETAVDTSKLVKTPEGVSRFARAYKLSSKRSRLLNYDAPARFVLDLLSGKETLDDVTLSYEMDGTQLAALKTLVSKEAGGIIKRMNAQLNEKAQVLLSGKYSLTEAIADRQLIANKKGEIHDVANMRNTRMVHIVDAETKQYNPKLIQIAALAGIHWVLTERGQASSVSYEDVAKQFGVQIEDVTPEMVAASSLGMNRNRSAESLARTIMEFWGAEANQAAPMSDTMGIAQAVAAEMLRAMEGRLTTEHPFDLKVATDGGEVTVSTVAVELSNDETKELVEKLTTARGFLAEAFIPSIEPDFHFDEVPPAPKKGATQKGNRFGKLSSRVLKAVRRHQEQKFYRNRPFLDLMNAAGKDFFLELLGLVPLDPKLTNKIDALSIKGRNNQLSRSWDGVQIHNQKLEGYASTQDKDPDEVATHFDWYVVSNSRIHAKGFNPQSDKVMREAFVSTVSTLDLTQEKDRDLFWMTVAQSSGLEKTEKGTRAENVASVQNKIFAKYGNSIAALQDWLEKGGELSNEAKDTLRAELAGAANAKLLHSLLAVARYGNAMGDTEALKSFKHNLSLEADGKTDGPINAMMHFITGAFSVDQIQNLRRGGFFPGEQGRTLNTMDKEADLYLKGAELFQRRLVQMRSKLKGTKGEESMEALLRLTSKFMKVEFDRKTGDLKIGRDVLKNPLTITVYGSGKRGIAGKLSTAILEGLYSALTELAREQDVLKDQQLELKSLGKFADYPELYQDLKTLLTTRVYFDKNGKAFQTEKVFRNGDAKAPFGNGKTDPTQFEFHFFNRVMLAENMLNLFVEPMSAAIEELTGTTQETTRRMQAATQIQSAVLIDRFRKATKDLLDQKRASGELGKQDYLTAADYNRLFKEFSKFGAIIEPVDSDANHVNLSGSEREESDQEFFRSLTNEYGGNAALPGPSSAGVGATPLMTISRGDATMMINFFARENLSDAELRTLQVFDGLEMPADGIDEISERINEAVSKGWLENPLQDVADSFADWMRQDSKGVLTGDESAPTVEAIQRALKAAEIEVDSETLQEGLQALRDDLLNRSRSAQARKNVIRSMGFSVDHMASGEAPYDHKGEIPEFSTDAELVSWMNQRYEEELSQLEALADDARVRPAVEAPNKGFLDLVKSHGAPMEGRNISRMTSRNLQRMLQLAEMQGSIRPETAQLMGAISKFLPDFTFFFGSSEELQKFRDEAYPETRSNGPIEHGQIDLIGGAIYIANQTGETVLHEALHAALMKHLLDAYHGKLSGVRQQAVENLESLMSQFMDMNFQAEEFGTQEAARILRREIETNLAKDTPWGRAVALSEFLSWTLANQNLIETLKKSKVRTPRPLHRLIDAALKGLRALLGLKPEQSLDMFSNIAFNAGALLTTSNLGDLNGEWSVRPEGSLNQLADLMRDFDAKITSWTTVRTVKPTAAQASGNERFAAEILANDAANRFMAHGFTMSPEQLSAFRKIQVALATSMEFDRASLVQIQKVYTHAIQQLSVESFMADPAGNDPNDRYQAQEKFNLLTGKYGSEKDRLGRSNLMSSFLALSQVDDGFRKILSTIDMPKTSDISGKSTDEFLASMTAKSLDTLAEKLAGTGSSSNVSAALDTMTAALSKIEEDDRTQLEKQWHNALGTADKKITGYLSKASEKLVDWAGPAIAKQNQGLRENTKTLLRGGALGLAALLDETRGKAMAETLTGFGNETKSKLLIPIMELMNETFGITDMNRGVYELVNRVKYAVSGLRQDHRETLPKILAEQFSRKLSDVEWGQLHLGLGKTDIAVLGFNHSINQIRAMLEDPAKLAKAVQTFEAKISSLAPKVAQTYLQKSDELAEFMVNGKVPHHHKLARNAHAIAALLGENNRKQAIVSKDLTQAIDQLTSLYALQKLDKGTTAKLAELAKTEAKGIEFLVYYMADLRRNERAKPQSITQEALYNGWKGFIPSEAREGAELVVRDDQDFAALKLKGFTRLGDYKGSGFEAGRKGYYFSTVSGNNTYQQGVMQTVQSSSFGVDPLTGRSVTGITAGLVPENEVGQIRALVARGQYGRSTEPLMPIFGPAGDVIGYERSMDPGMLKTLDRNEHLGEMIGAWAGRQAEEQLADGFNKMLVDRLWDVWDRDSKSGRKGEFVNLASDKLNDQIYKDAWGVIPRDMRDYITQKFGTETFMVRKDMVNNALGYRLPSVADAWTGKTRLHQEAQNTIKVMATAVMGDKAFKYLVTAEKAWQAGVSVAKNTIVIRSIVVPLSNIMSNFVQLTANGVDMRSIVKGMPEKLVEIDQHLKNLARKVEIEALIARHRKDPGMIRKLEVERQSLDDSSRRMSIWPLIEAGEFSTISEGLTEADAAISQGKWADWIQAQIERVPSQLGTIGRYAIVARDTALFKGMSRATQYGDFLAKAVLYEHLIKQQGKSEKEALEKVTEEFVNYNLLPGRTRSYAESMGLTWFWAYKLRSMKVALNHIRNNPFRVLISGLGGQMVPEVPGVSVGTPVTDNFVSAWADGRIGYSTGPGMMFNAPYLNPWVNIAN